MADMVNHPPHYQSEFLECIEVTRHLHHCLGNAVKYVWRSRDKGDPKENIKKAVWYLDDFLLNVLKTPMRDSVLQQLVKTSKYFLYDGIYDRLVTYSNDLDIKSPGTPESEFFYVLTEMLYNVANYNHVDRVEEYVNTMKNTLERTVG